MDAFTRAYIEAALWSSEDDFGEPLERNYDAAAFAPEAFGPPPTMITSGGMLVL